MPLLLVSLWKTEPLRLAVSCRKLSKLARSATTKALYKLPDAPARTRFAPSPTGYLHLGSLRTALFSYLLAKSTQGQFILRLEDTDQKRTVPGAEQRIKEDLLWAGLRCDEGPDTGGPYGPYKQSERLEIYQEYAAKLLAAGKAYRCFCPKEKQDLQAALKGAIHIPAELKAHDCHHVSKAVSDERAALGKPFVVKLRVPAQTPIYKDLVYGIVSAPKKSAVAPDLILMKSDGWPTYHLANVVDDHLMNITHVIRGTEWIVSTPYHLILYDAFGWKPPVFGHVGLLTDMEGQKLSKRKLDIDISSFKKMGVLPDALDNFVALLGWSHTCEEDKMTLDQLVKNFSTKFTKGDVKVQFDKLWFLQKKHAAELVSSAPTPEALVPSMIQPIIDILKETRSPLVAPDGTSLAHLQRLIFCLLKGDARNYKNAQDFVERHKKTFHAPSAVELQAADPAIADLGIIEHRPAAQALGVPSVSILEIDKIVKRILDSTPSHVEDSVESQFVQLRTKFVELASKLAELSLSKIRSSNNKADLDTLKKSWISILHRYMRWALVASMPGPDALYVLLALSKEESSKRLNLAASLATKTPEA